jgi:hypothetical protein
MFCVPQAELLVDRLLPLAVFHIGLAVVLARLAAEDWLTAALTGDAPDKLLPAEAIIVGPEDIRKRWNARRLDDLGPPDHRCQSVPSVLRTRSAAKGRNDRPGHSDLIGFERLERLLFSALGIISIGVLAAQALAVAATPELDASKPGRWFGDESSMAVGQDLGHHFRGASLKRSSTVGRQQSIEPDCESVEVGSVGLLGDSALDESADDLAPDGDQGIDRHAHALDSSASNSSDFRRCGTLRLTPKVVVEPNWREPQAGSWRSTIGFLRSSHSADYRAAGDRDGAQKGGLTTLASLASNPRLSA